MRFLLFTIYFTSLIHVSARTCNSFPIYLSSSGDTALIFFGFFTDCTHTDSTQTYAEFTLLTSYPGSKNSLAVKRFIEIPVISSDINPWDAMPVDTLSFFKLHSTGYCLDLTRDSTLKYEITERNSKYIGRQKQTTITHEKVYGKSKTRKIKSKYYERMYSCDYNLKIIFKDSTIYEVTNVNTIYASTGGNVQDDPEVFEFYVWKSDSLNLFLVYFTHNTKDNGWKEGRTTVYADERFLVIHNSP